MSYEANSGLGVGQFYGRRTLVEGIAGYVGRHGSEHELVLEFGGEAINDGTMETCAIIPANALITAVYADVEEACTLTGTTPAIEIGTDGSEATNGVTISEANAEAAGVYNLTAGLSGTWAAGLTADTTVSVVLSGTTPVITDAGRIKVVIKYVHVSV